ncbi:hypothetical protein WDU94_010284 [Cyamophila willieti]
MVLLYFIPLSLQDKLEWRDVDIKANNLTQFNGQDLCKDNQAGCLFHFHNYVAEHWFSSGKIDIRAACDPDDTLGKGTIVCWLRRKESNGFPTFQKWTHYQMQFWTDKNGKSHCRDNYPRAK